MDTAPIKKEEEMAREKKRQFSREIFYFRLEVEPDQVSPEEERHFDFTLVVNGTEYRYRANLPEDDLESLYDKLFREAQKRFQEVFQKGEDLLKDEWKKHPRHWADSGPAK